MRQMTVVEWPASLFEDGDGWVPTWRWGFDLLDDCKADLAEREHSDESRHKIEEIAEATFTWWRRLELMRHAINAWCDTILLER